MIQLNNSWFIEDDYLYLKEGDETYKISESYDSPGYFIVYRKLDNNTWEKLKTLEGFEEACLYAAI